MSARAAVVYDERARALIRAWKERGLRRLSEPAAAIVVACIPRPSGDVVAFIPPDGDRSLIRGHHPAGNLAAALGRAWGIPVRALLTRTGERRRQTGLSLAERRKNLRGAFVAAPPVPARICLVDDVYTTGATAQAAASALRKAGARSVDVVTFARAVR